MQKDGLVVKYISARLVTVRLNLKGKSNGISCVIAYAPTDSHTSVREEDLFLAARGSTGAEVLKTEQISVMMDAKTRTSRKGEGRVDDEVLCAFGRDTLNDNGRRLLAFSAEKQLALVNTFFSAPKRGISYTFQSPNLGKDRYRLDYSLTRQSDRRLIQNVTVRRPPLVKQESDHNLVTADVFLENSPLTAAIEDRRAGGRSTSNN